MDKVKKAKIHPFGKDGSPYSVDSNLNPLNKNKKQKEEKKEKGEMNNGKF